MKEIAIEGLDGAGKSTIALLLAQQYKAEGLKAEVFTPYKDVKEEYGCEIYPLWKSTNGAKTCIDIRQLLIVVHWPRSKN